MPSFNAERWYFRLLVFGAVLVLPAIQFLVYNQYSFFTIEACLLLFVLVVIAGLAALITRTPNAFDIVVVCVAVLAYSPYIQVHAPLFQDLRMRWSSLLVLVAVGGMLYLLRSNFYDPQESTLQKAFWNELRLALLHFWLVRRKMLQ